MERSIVESAREVCGSVRGRGKSKGVSGGTMRQNLRLGERRLPGKKCLELEIKRQKKDG